MAFFKWLLAVVICASITKMPGTVSERFHRLPANLSTEKKRVCANRGDALSLSCTLNLLGTKKASREWTLSWHSDGITFKKNATEKWQNSTHLSSSLRLHAVWSGEKLFTCVATRLSKTSKGLDTSLQTSTVVNVKSSTQCSIIGSRFIEQPNVNLFEVYWRPVKQPLKNVVYSLNICTEQPEGLPLNGVCPHYYTVKGWCFYSEKNIYNLNNTNGFICKANVSSRITVYRTFISSKVKDEDCELRCSTEKRFYLNIFRDLIPEPDAIEIVLIPSPVANMHVIPRPSREVTLDWSDSPSTQHKGARRYKVLYRCSKDRNWSSTAYLISKKHTLNTNNFPNYQPYDLCRFCVAARAFTFGITSEPLCQEIRLHEEPPSSAPKISCSGNECLSTRDGHARNVSIAWTIPPRKDWNGVLYELRIFYSSSLENSSHHWHNIKIPVQNNTVNGETLLTGISINETTFIYMTACNKEGCSDPGRTFKVSPLPPSVTDFSIDTVVGSSPSKSLIGLASVAALILTTCLVCVSYACLKTRRSLQPKIQLTLCEPSGYDVIVHGEKVEYDVIVMTDMPTYVDITQVNDDATQLAAICRLKADSTMYSQLQSQQEKRRVDKVHVLEQSKNADKQTL